MGGPGDSAASEAPPTARPAATVVIARDAHQGGLEVFLVQRHGKLGFMGGMHVFPGGKVCDEDREPALHGRVADPEAIEAHDVWGEGFGRADAWALAMAAVRETFEESGLLLAGDALAADALAEQRARLHEGAAFLDALTELDAHLSLRLLAPLARWITPESEPVRFDTAFYLARAPEGQAASHDRSETVGGTWFEPAAALRASEQGAIRLAPPTSQTLQGLCEMESVEAALQRARAGRPPVILPLLRWQGDTLYVVYPGDPEHPLKTPALPGPTRRPLRTR